MKSNNEAGDHTSSQSRSRVTTGRTESAPKVLYAGARVWGRRSSFLFQAPPPAISLEMSEERVLANMAASTGDYTALELRALGIAASAPPLKR